MWIEWQSKAGSVAVRSLVSEAGCWDMNITSLVQKELELVQEVERYPLDKVRLSSMHSLGSGINLLKRGWTLFFAEVFPDDRRRTGVGLRMATCFSASVLEFTLWPKALLPCAFGCENRS